MMQFYKEIVCILEFVYIFVETSRRIKIHLVKVDVSKSMVLEESILKLLFLIHTV